MTDSKQLDSTRDSLEFPEAEDVLEGNTVYQGNIA
jgi:hypothetical protein